jgi:hypothetical protein
VVAAGTEVTLRPPLRSARAALRHTAPASSHSAKPLIRVRVKHSNQRQVAGDETPKPSPGHPTMLDAYGSVRGSEPSVTGNNAGFGRLLTFLA